MNYTVRRTLFTGHETFTLKENKLYIETTKKNKLAISLPFTQVKKVNLIYVPGYKNTPELYQCTLKTTNNKTIKISNNHYESFGDAYPKNIEYSTFITALHKELETYKNITFEKGTSSSAYRVYTIIFGFLLLCLLSIGIIGLIKQEVNVGISMLIGTILFGGFFYRLSKSYKPEKYNPKEIPSSVIPITN